VIGDGDSPISMGGSNPLPPHRRRGWHLGRRRKKTEDGRTPGPSHGFPGRPPRPLDTRAQDPKHAGWGWIAWTAEGFFRGVKRWNGMAMDFLTGRSRRRDD